MDSNLSIGRIILLTYLIIASSYCTNLFSKGLQREIESNIYVQHIILIILIMSLMIIFGTPFDIGITSNKQINIVIMTLLIYAWFIMTTKLDYAWNIAILILLTIYFLYESKKIDDCNMLLKDSNLDDIEKQEIISTYNTVQKYLLVGLFGITIVGTLLYADEKKNQYGGDFSYKKFITTIN